MEGCHANHRIPIVLDYEHVASCVEANALLVIKKKSYLMPMD